MHCARWVIRSQNAPLSVCPVEQSGYKKVHLEKRDSVDTKRISSTMVESSVLFFLLRVSRVWKRVGGTVAWFDSQCLHHLNLKEFHTRSCRNAMEHGLQADRRDTVDDNSSANALAGFSSVQKVPIQEGEAAWSSDVAEPFPKAAEVGRVSQEAVPIEQGQPLRAVEPNEWATKVRAKPLPETPTQRQRDIHEVTHLPLVFSYPARVWKSR